MYRIIRHIGVLLAFVAQVRFTVAQNKAVTVDSDTTFWYRYVRSNAHKLQLPDLRQSGAVRQWRLWFNGQTISYVIDLHNGEGQLIFYTQEYKDPVTEKLSQRIFSKSYALNSWQLQSIDSLKTVAGIEAIPTDKQIKGWGDVMGFDGVTYTIEEADKSTYSFKSYWTPASIDVDEAKKLKHFIEVIEQLINYQKLHMEFSKLIPFSSYSTGGPMIVMKIMTAEQARKLLKERKAYRRRTSKMKQSVDQTP